MRRLVERLEPEPEVEDEDVFASIGLPHGGFWRRRPGEEVLVCAEHELRVDEHEAP